MAGQKAQRFGLADAIVLVAATAGGLAFAHAMASDIRVNTSVDQARELTTGLTVALAFCWTCALVGLHLTRYRRPRRDLASQPGFAAMVAVLMDFVGEGLQRATVVRIEAPDLFPPVRFTNLINIFYEILFVYIIGTPHSYSRMMIVVTVWSLMWMAGYWRAEKTWLDRSGRVLGVFWIIAYFLYWLCKWSFPDPIPDWVPGA